MPDQELQLDEWFQIGAETGASVQRRDRPIQQPQDHAVLDWSVTNLVFGTISVAQVDLTLRFPGASMFTEILERIEVSTHESAALPPFMKNIISVQQQNLNQGDELTFRVTLNHPVTTDDSSAPTYQLNIKVYGNYE